MERQLGKTINLPSGSRVLDAGCGEGVVAVHLNKAFGYRINGVDVLAWSIENANKNKIKEGLTDLNFVVGNYSNLDFPDASFDVSIRWKHLSTLQTTGGRFKNCIVS